MKAYWMFQFLTCASLAASTVVLPDGRAFLVSDWTPPVSESVPGLNGGNVPVVKRLTTVMDLRNTAATIPVVFLYEPAKRQVWLSRPSDQYFALEDRIYGARV